MPQSFLKRRFLQRLAVPQDAGDIRRTERWLATARVALAISSLAAIWMDPEVIGYSPWAYWLVGIYIVHGVVVMMLLRLRRQSTPAFRRLVHAADIVWPAVISAFSSAQTNPFFLFFLFVLAAAAYRWGLWETLGTAGIAVTLLWAESFAVETGFIPWVDHLFSSYGLKHLGLDMTQLEPKHLFMRSVYLLVMGLLLGYMAEQQKKLRAEKAVVARILGGARVEAGLSATIEKILAEILPMYAAERAMIASQEANSYRVFLGEMKASRNGAAAISWHESSPSDNEVYLYESRAQTCYASRKKGGFEVRALDKNGLRLRNEPSDFVERLARFHDFHSVITVSFVFGDEWTGRIFLFNSVLTGDRDEELRFLCEMVRQVGPAVYNVYLMRRLRLKAGAVERARFARELHDGAVQSLIAMEMQVDVLRRQSATQAVPVTEELGRIQSLLREEVLNLRELMQQMKTFEVDAKRFVPFVTDTVERFQRETGITARFISEPHDIDLSPKVCRELARIVQEGLVNVRKHSGAKNVLVRLDQRDGRYRITVEDDGRGFAFSGRLSHTELEQLGKGPLVIKERVRLIEGELTIESNPGQGARLEICVPHKHQPAYG
ncbi:MAG TPA: sensor histidine kinase [Terriglobales bacterium]|nr:sensor histidine kinase [Terriglobales bacterium]